MSLSPDAATAPTVETCSSFDGLTIALHWTTVVIVLSQFATAWSIDHVEPSLAPTMLTLHRSGGFLLWLLVAGRLAWRFTGMRKPPFPASIKPAHGVAVQLSEYALYTLLIVQPMTGALDSVFRGHAFNLFFLSVPALVHRNRSVAALAHQAHEVGAYTLAAFVSLHAIAALAHHFVLKDQILRRMAPTHWGS
jgi:cytochrome b561